MILRMDRVNSPGNTPKSVEIRGNSARTVVNSNMGLVQLHKKLLKSLKNLICLLRDLIKS